MPKATPEEFATSIAIHAIDQQTTNLARLVAFLGPNDTISALSSIVMNAVSTIPDEKWAEVVLLAPIPCGWEGCHCERINGPLIEALDKLRGPFRELTKEIDGEEAGK